MWPTADLGRKAHPLPEPTGKAVDKALFDWLCGEDEQKAVDHSPEIPPHRRSKRSVFFPA
jgi:hypothetical protein